MHHARQRAEDDDGEVGERHRRRRRRDGRRQRRRLRRPHERRGAAARHDALAFRQSERPARREQLYVARATWRSSRRALLTRVPANTATISSCRRSRSAARVLKNYNTLLERYPGATGMKTGFICASGYNLVGIGASAAGREVIAVVFGAVRRQGARRARGRSCSTRASPRRRRGRRDLYDARRRQVRRGLRRRPSTCAPYVCGPKRVTVGVGGRTTKATRRRPGIASDREPIDLGPPVKVSAVVPADLRRAGLRGAAAAPAARRSERRRRTPTCSTPTRPATSGGDLRADRRDRRGGRAAPHPLDDVAPPNSALSPSRSRSGASSPSRLRASRRWPLLAAEIRHVDRRHRIVG